MRVPHSAPVPRHVATLPYPLAVHLRKGAGPIAHPCTAEWAGSGTISVTTKTRSGTTCRLATPICSLPIRKVSSDSTGQYRPPPPPLHRTGGRTIAASHRSPPPRTPPRPNWIAPRHRLVFLGKPNHYLQNTIPNSFFRLFSGELIGQGVGRSSLRRKRKIL